MKLFLPEKIKIGFSGHRDCCTLESALDNVRLEYPKATWIYGAAKDGFDAQLAAYALHYQVELVPVKPQYRFSNDRRAPIIRNEVIVKQSDLLYICYDGRRQTGGTVSVIRFAKQYAKPLKYLPCHKIVTQL